MRDFWIHLRQDFVGSLFVLFSDSLTTAIYFEALSSLVSEMAVEN